MASQDAGAYLDPCLSDQWMDNFVDLDWQEEIRLVALWYFEQSRYELVALTKLGRYVERRLQPLGNYIDRQKYRLANEIRLMLPREHHRPRRHETHGRRGLARQHFPSSSRRYSEFYPYLYIWGWPSRGGVIILEHASAVDCEFLSLDHLHLIERRASTQEDEDELCQKLLHLGAKWWDSENRFRRVLALTLYSLHAPSYDLKCPPTTAETRNICVGWPSTGGLWVARFSSGYFRVGSRESSQHAPDELTLLRLTRTMDERCQVLRDQFDAKFYGNLKDVDDEFLNSWETKFTGEVEPMVAERGGYYEAISPGPPGWRVDSSEDEEYDGDTDDDG